MPKRSIREYTLIPSQLFTQYITSFNAFSFLMFNCDVRTCSNKSTYMHEKFFEFNIADDHFGVYEDEDEERFTKLNFTYKGHDIIHIGYYFDCWSINVTHGNFVNDETLNEFIWKYIELFEKHMYDHRKINDDLSNDDALEKYKKAQDLDFIKKAKKEFIELLDNYDFQEEEGEKEEE